MKLASLKNGSRDGLLVVVSRDLSRCVAVPAVAATMQQLLDNWQERHNQISTLASNLSNSYDGLDTNALLSSSNYDRPIFENFIATFGYRELKLVLPDGTIVASKLNQSSGNRAWDDAVLRAVAPLVEPLMALFQQVFQQMKDATAAEWQPRLSATNTRLDALQQQLLARSAAVNRALGTLFPAEQGNAYARLGRSGNMGGLPRVSNNTSFKA